MARFAGEFVPPDLSAPFVRKVAAASLETLAMSALGTLLAAAAGLLLALPASRTHEGDPARAFLAHWGDRDYTVRVYSSGSMVVVPGDRRSEVP